MALVGVELETLVLEPDAQTTRLPPSVLSDFVSAVQCMWPDYRAMNIL